jgi:hypothetical protein
MHSSSNYVQYTQFQPNMYTVYRVNQVAPYITLTHRRISLSLNKHHNKYIHKMHQYMLVNPKTAFQNVSQHNYKMYNKILP